MIAARDTHRLTIHTRLEDVPPIWDELEHAGGMSFDRHFLRVVQQCAVDANTRRYLVYQSSTGAAGIAVAQILSKPCRDNPVTDILLGRLSDRLAAGRNWPLPMLLLRADLNGDSPVVAVAPAGAERTTVLVEMLGALQKHATREGWSLATAGVPSDDLAMIGALRRSGYLQTEGWPVAELFLQWDSWEGFLKYARGRSKNAAANIRTEENRARREGVTFVEWDPDSTPEATLFRLQDEHERRRNGRGFRFQAGFLSALSQVLDSRVRVLLAFSGKGEVQGVSVLAYKGRRGYVVFVGMIEKAERTGSAYFNLVYYQPLRLAIELRLESLAYGVGTLPAKIRRGSVVAATGLFIRPQLALTRAVLRGPVALHRRLLRKKFAPLLQASPFSNLK
jgi:predicted N-acyltransferase